jgi:hypothetical protein
MAGWDADLEWFDPRERCFMKKSRAQKFRVYLFKFELNSITQPYYLHHG